MSARRRPPAPRHYAREMVVPILIAFIGALPTTIIAWGALHKGQEVEAKTEEIIEKTEVIHTLVNSNLTAVQDDLKLANERIERLQGLIEELVAKQAEAPGG